MPNKQDKIKEERKTKNLLAGIILNTGDLKNRFQMNSIGSIFWISFANKEIKAADDIDADLNAIETDLQ